MVFFGAPPCSDAPRAAVAIRGYLASKGLRGEPLPGDPSAGLFLPVDSSLIFDPPKAS
jgi:hypothetical protein